MAEAERQAGNPVQPADELVDLEPRIAREPFVGPLAGERDLVTVLVDRARQIAASPGTTCR